MSCTIDGHKIRCKRDLETFIAKIETEWRRTLTETAKAFLYSEFESCFENDKLTSEQKQKLETVWREREKQARIHGYQK